MLICELLMIWGVKSSSEPQAQVITFMVPLEARLVTDSKV